MKLIALLSGKTDFKVKKKDFKATFKKDKMSYFMEHFLKECLMHSEGNNSKLKLWLRKYIKQKLKYKVQWKTLSYRETVSYVFQNLVKEAVKKIS